jgi:hypothetical protein
LQKRTSTSSAQRDAVEHAIEAAVVHVVETCVAVFDVFRRVIFAVVDALRGVHAAEALLEVVADVVAVDLLLEVAAEAGCGEQERRRESESLEHGVLREPTVFTVSLAGLD